MDGQCLKNYLEMVSDGWENLNEISEFDEHFIKKCDADTDKGYIFEVDIEYPKNLFNLHKDFLFLPERKKIEKCIKIVCSIHDKQNYKTKIKSWINTKKSIQSNSN